MNKKFIKGRLNKIQEFAEDIALSQFDGKKPIDPFILATNSEIEIIGDNFNNEFDGRCEVINKKFVIFYDNHLPDSHPRIRFTIAHELGHCEILEHRKYLLSGGAPYNCTVDFVANSNEPEWEADHFASALLLPRPIFEPLLNKKEPNMKHLIQLSKTMNTSITSTILRSVELCEWPFSILKIKDNKVVWAFHSPSMIDMGFTFIKNGDLIPKTSILNRKKHSETGQIIEGSSGSINWFPDHKGKDITFWEEAILIEKTNEILLLITFQDYEKDWVV